MFRENASKNRFFCIFPINLINSPLDTTASMRSFWVLWIFGRFFCIFCNSPRKSLWNADKQGISGSQSLYTSNRIPVCTPHSPLYFGRIGRSLALKFVNRAFTTFIQIYRFLFYDTDWICISVYKENGRNADKHKDFSRFANWNIQIYRLFAYSERGERGGERANRADMHTKGWPPHPYMGYRWPPAKYLKRQKRKICVTGLYFPRCPESAASAAVPHPWCASVSSPVAGSRLSAGHGCAECCAPGC